jgi:hypothetical protein
MTEPGHCVVYRTDEGPVITEAGEFIWISRELIDSADPEWVDHGEGLIRLRAVNRTVVYRLSAYDHMHDVWPATKVSDLTNPGRPE